MLERTRRRSALDGGGMGTNDVVATFCEDHDPHGI